jgi:hypothetical protein
VITYVKATPAQPAAGGGGEDTSRAVGSAVFIHTLNTESGFCRKLMGLGVIDYWPWLQVQRQCNSCPAAPELSCVLPTADVDAAAYRSGFLVVQFLPEPQRTAVAFLACNVLRWWVAGPRSCRRLRAVQRVAGALQPG